MTIPTLKLLIGDWIKEESLPIKYYVENGTMYGKDGQLKAYVVAGEVSEWSPSGEDWVYGVNYQPDELHLLLFPADPEFFEKLRSHLLK